MSPRNLPHHVVNEDYGNYVRRQALKDNRFMTWLGMGLIFVALIYISGTIFENLGLRDSGVFGFLAIGVFLVAGYLSYKLYKRSYIPKRRYSERELMDTYE